jgi:hypothetical protein
MNPAVLHPEGPARLRGDSRIDPRQPVVFAATAHAHGCRARADRSGMRPHRLTWLAIALLVCTGGSMVHVESAHATPATVLLAKYSELRGKLEDNPFQKPLYLDSSEIAGEVKGNLYALIQESFPTVQSALKEPAHWCDILILHLNTKYCRASTAGAWTVLKVNIGKKAEQPIAQSYRVELSYRAIAVTPDHLAVGEVELDRVAVGVVPLDPPEPVDVVSSDRHTVKPWFNGRIPISPRVVDLAKENFPLIGGRIDVVGQAPVSTLVYRHAKHLISLTAMPIDSRFELEKTPRAVNGYNVVHWVDNGVSYWAISDLQAKELEEFAQLFRTAQTEL